ncbi:hypothetical protein FSP39_021382 [Pinctada imbricata]|uniref:G-protein coupled receptors family 1 profile domain-containing protein n=1 Tax=Pinctada imbricata TaxID=66713 RepID=A0AA89BQ59_PINIB|nr:hypothetical protein FSP39_021382 [Pinctada imbricata]
MLNFKEIKGSSTLGCKPPKTPNAKTQQTRTERDTKGTKNTYSLHRNMKQKRPHINQREQWATGADLGPSSSIQVADGTFLVSWTPYAILSLYVVATGDGDINPVLGTVPAVIAKMSTVWNPIIYISLNKSFKEAWIATFPCCQRVCERRVNPGPAPEEFQPEGKDPELRPRGPLADAMNNVDDFKNQNQPNCQSLSLVATSDV